MLQAKRYELPSQGAYINQSGDRSNSPVLSQSNASCSASMVAFLRPG